MADFLLIQSRDPFESRGSESFLDWARRLVAQGNGVTLFLVENGVLAARAGAKNESLAALAKSGVALLADEFSLRERGIGPDRLLAQVRASPLDLVVDRLAAGAKTLWH